MQCAILAQRGKHEKQPMESESGHLYRILDKNLKRVNKLSNWTAPDIVSFEYWDVRYILPRLVMDGVEEVISYLVSKYNIKGKISDKEKFSFFFHLKDELVRVSEMERTGEASLVSRMSAKVGKSKVKPSPRRATFPELMELDLLAKGDPEKAQRIKKMPYEQVWETLLAEAIKREDEYPTG